MGVLKDVSLNHQTGAPAVVLAKSDPLMFGSSLADVFSAPAYDCRALGHDQKPEFAVTRLRSGPREMEKAPSTPPITPSSSVSRLRRQRSDNGEHDTTGARLESHERSHSRRHISI